MGSSKYTHDQTNENFIRIQMNHKRQICFFRVRLRIGLKMKLNSSYINNIELIMAKKNQINLYMKKSNKSYLDN